ncbi:MFS general substrate transporter [Phellopilus nigrolimitatus]|nr:MFS general substrate transporter [Phellopilus nigrolimitatus]
MSQKAVAFEVVDVEAKGNSKEEAERPIVTIVSSATTPATTACNTPVMTPKDEPEEYELQTLPRSTVTSAPLFPNPPSISAIDKKAARRKEHIAFGALLWAIFMEGWNDGTNGPLLPAMQHHYNIGFTVVSLIFVANCIGFVSGAVANVRMVQKLGFGTTLVIGASAQAVAYCMQAPAPPFPVFAIAYIFSGFGIALQNSGSLVFVVNLNENSSTKMGVLQAAYGLGALVSPLSATKFASIPHWSFHFLASLSGAIINIMSLVLVFRFRDMNTILAKAGQVVREQNSSQGHNLYSQIFKLKVVHLLALFALAYVGAEVTLGGWIVTFVIDERGGGSSSGYLTTGFFAGMTVGRLCLLWFNKLIGERRVIWIYIALCIALEITIWFVPSLVGNAIAVAFVGLFLGPIYPILINVAGRLVPHWLVNGAIGWIGGLGQTGSALLPFVTGALSSKFGVRSLQPLIVSVMCAMLGLWAIVPPDVRRSD